MRWSSDAAGRRVRTVRAVLAAIASAVLVPGLALAASPSPTNPGIGDPRSSGQGPGLVGDPLWAILIVAAIAALSLAATLVYVRATANRSSRPPR